jgi:hypothetical protein
MPKVRITIKLAVGQRVFGEGVIGSPIGIGDLAKNALGIPAYYHQGCIIIYDTERLGLVFAGRLVRKGAKDDVSFTDSSELMDGDIIHFDRLRPGILKVDWAARPA